MTPWTVTRLAPLSMGASSVAPLVRKLVKGKMCLQSSAGPRVVRGWLRSPACRGFDFLSQGAEHSESVRYSSGEAEKERRPQQKQG